MIQYGWKCIKLPHDLLSDPEPPYIGGPEPQETSCHATYNLHTLSRKIRARNRHIIRFCLRHNSRTVHATKLLFSYSWGVGISHLIFEPLVVDRGSNNLVQSVYSISKKSSSTHVQYTSKYLAPQHKRSNSGCIRIPLQRLVLIVFQQWGEATMLACGNVPWQQEKAFRRNACAA